MNFSSFVFIFQGVEIQLTKKKLAKYLRPVMNNLSDQFEQWMNAYGHNYKVYSMLITNDPT